MDLSGSASEIIWCAREGVPSGRHTEEGATSHSLNASTLDGSNADISACSREFSFCVIAVLQPSLSIRRWWSSPKV